jgi:hypothetical protein
VDKNPKFILCQSLQNSVPGDQAFFGAGNRVLGYPNLESAEIVYEDTFEEADDLRASVAYLAGARKTAVDVATLFPRHAFRLPAIEVPRLGYCPHSPKRIVGIIGHARRDIKD